MPRPAKAPETPAVEPVAPAAPAAEPTPAPAPAPDNADFNKAFDKIASETPAEPEQDPEAPAPAAAAPKKKPDPKPAAPDAEPAPAEPGAEEEPDEEEDDDELEDKAPEGLSEKARARFSEILGKNKELGAKAEKLEQNFSELTAWVKETGATAQEFQQQVDRLRVFKTGKPEELKTLRTDLLEAVKDITVRLGDDAPGFDPLEGFEDLTKDVEDMKLTLERAREIALARRGKARGDRINAETTTRTAEQERQEAHRTEVTAAMAAIRKLEAGWNEHDPDAARKVKAIMAGIEDFKYIPPNLWAAAVKRRYESLAGLAPARPGQVPRPSGGTRPKPGAEAQPASLGGLMESMVER